jgi:hypothetical protein
MINIKRLASGLADDLLSVRPDPSEAKSLIEDAFLRGFRLGLSVRGANSFSPRSKHTPERKDAEPWTTTH